MKLKTKTITSLVIALLAFGSMTGFANKRKLTPQARLQIAQSRTHKIREIHVYNHRDGRQHLQFVGDGPGHYNTPVRRKGESGSQHTKRIQQAAEQMLRDAQDAARQFGIKP